MLLNFRPTCAHKLRDNRKAPIYRSGDLLALNDYDVNKIQDCGIMHYIDLRTVGEVEQFGVSDKLLQTDIIYRHFPIDDDDHYLRKISAPNGEDYFNYYAHLLENNKVTIRELILYISNILSMPFMYGCYAGKDRTGIISILLLLLLEFDLEDIVHDYTLSGDYLKMNIDYFQSKWEKKGLTREQYANRMTPFAGTVILLIDHIKRQFGNILGYFSYLEIPMSSLHLTSKTLRMYYDIG